MKTEEAKQSAHEAKETADHKANRVGHSLALSATVESLTRITLLADGGWRPRSKRGVQEGSPQIDFGQLLQVHAYLMIVLDPSSNFI